MKIGIIEYGCGNVGSVQNMFSKVGVWSELVSDPANIGQYNAIVLPGVGSFDTGVKKLKESGFWDGLNKIALEGKVPVLGICLGMQLMFQGSDEGSEKGFGWFSGYCKKFEIDLVKRIPNIGWNSLTINSKLDNNYFSEEEMMFYFVHSYHAPQNMNPNEVLATSSYFIDFPAAIEKSNLTGFQFHPEKSLKHGMTLLKNWTNKIVNEK